MIFSNNKVYNLDDIIKKLENNGYSSFTEFAEDVIIVGKSGKDIDMTLPMMAINIIKHSDISNFNRQTLSVSVTRLNDFIKLAKDAIITTFNPFTNQVVCIYNDFTIFPVARIYEYIVKNGMEVEKIKEVVRFETQNIQKTLDLKNVDERIEAYIKKNEKRFEKLTRFVQGRIDNTSVKGGIVIATEDFRCPACNTSIDKESSIETLSFSNETFGVQIAMEICSTCLSNEAHDNSLLKYLLVNMNLLKILKSRELTIEEVREISKNIVEVYLESKVIDKENIEIDTITAVRKSGYILKLRITDISNYGYMILSPMQEELIRFDNAPDHPDKVEFMPHHVHNNVQEEEKIKKEAKRMSKKKKRKHLNKKNITDSFLTGYLGLDYTSIKNRLIALESNI